MIKKKDDLRSVLLFGLWNSHSYVIAKEAVTASLLKHLLFSWWSSPVQLILKEAIET